MKNMSAPKLSPIDPPALTDREAILAAVRKMSPNLSMDDQIVSDIRGGRAGAGERLAHLDPERYGKSRNYLDGAVTQLSPYIRHGIIPTTLPRDRALEQASAKTSEKFIQQLAWHEYWHRIYADAPDHIWNDIEDYKTGFSYSDYADDLPEDIARGETGVACIDQFIAQLLETGYLHNRMRLYLSGYVCHFRRVKWQAGAQWFLTHLLDGDPASNNLSWQWVASTFSHKPYYYNLDNVQKYSDYSIDTSFNRNKALAGSYEDVAARLFLNLDEKP